MFLLSFMLCGTSFIVTGLVYVFVIVEAAARTSRAGCVFLFCCWISGEELGKGRIFELWRFSCFYRRSVTDAILNLSCGLKHRTRTFQWYQKEILGAGKCLLVFWERVRTLGA